MIAAASRPARSAGSVLAPVAASRLVVDADERALEAFDMHDEVALECTGVKVVTLIDGWGIGEHHGIG